MQKCKPAARGEVLSDHDRVLTAVCAKALLCLQLTLHPKAWALGGRLAVTMAALTRWFLTVGCCLPGLAAQHCGPARCELLAWCPCTILTLWAPRRFGMQLPRLVAGSVLISGSEAASPAWTARTSTVQLGARAGHLGKELMGRSFFIFHWTVVVVWGAHLRE